MGLLTDLLGGDNATSAQPNAKIGGGALQLGVPNAQFTSVATRALSANRVHYLPFRVAGPLTVDRVSFEVTTGPASAANMRVGLYRADDELQPDGAPLFDHAVAVGSATTGVFTQAIANAVLAPGWYLSTMNPGVAMTVRILNGGHTILAPTLGVNPIHQFLFASQTYGTLPTPGTPWAGVAAAAAPAHALFYRWSI